MTVGLNLITSFWKTVEDCLTEFHGLNSLAAKDAIYAYRDRLADEAREFGPEWMDDLIYHAEPWQLACNLAGNNLDLGGYLDRYEKIRSKNGLIDFNLQPIKIGQSYLSFIKV